MPQQRRADLAADARQVGGVPALVVERAGGPSTHPRATGLGFRTLEFFRQVGIADAVEAVAVRRTATLGKIAAPTLATADLPDTPPAVPNSPNVVADGGRSEVRAALGMAAVLDGAAGPALLDTYEAERRPVAALVLDQALRRLADPRLHWEQGPAAAAAHAAAGVVNAPVVHLGYRYDSAAVLGARPELPSTEDAVLDGTPGSRLPHAWLADGLSTLDLVGRGLTLLTGPGKPPTGDFDVHVVEDEEWLRATGIADGSAVLVRPDEAAGAVGRILARR
ncbi:FAD-dependent monooxygenase [Amycolatopsis sp. NPDC051061]|uniref:FAD-dependent monooxygenase n=1 Tax=Amycolatopsis sp. NPDC051061 TaxID=3155042 RepID=UPI003424A1A9